MAKQSFVLSQHQKIRSSSAFDRRETRGQFSQLRCTCGMCVRPPEVNMEIEIEPGSRGELQGVEQEYPAL